jgi:hypothetical protein
MSDRIRNTGSKIGAPGPNLYIAEEIAGNRFKIAGGKPGSKVSWLVTGIRHDPYANAHPIQAEVRKEGDEKGKYLRPDEWRQPESMGVDYEKRQTLVTGQLEPSQDRNP